jgi:tRNA dimethylallyltransferase
MVSAKSKPELLAIVGETASGKSDLALRIARAYKGEIIAADSWTVYRGFNIGTGKPTITQQKAVKHHLIDVREPADGFNAPMFKTMAEKAIIDIQKRGKLPILVGGTGLYIDSVLYDFGFLTSVSGDKREDLNNMDITNLIEMAKSRSIDLMDIDIRNKRRLIRAIEAGGVKPTKGGLRPGTLIVGLKVDNDQLRKRVGHRTEQMLKAGLEQEVKALVGQYGWEIEPMKGIGYREWWQYFEGAQTLEETKQRIISSTMKLAKRQRTWFKRNPDIQWFSSAEKVEAFLSEKTLGI